MKIRIITSLLFTLVSLCAAAQSRETIPADVRLLTDSLRSIYAPDGRTAIFDVDYTFAGKRVMVRGRTTSAACRAALYDALGKAGYDAVECMRTLPDSRLGADTLAVVRLSVCNMRSTGGLLGRDGVAGTHGNARTGTRLRRMVSHTDSRRLHSMGTPRRHRTDGCRAYA